MEASLVRVQLDLIIIIILLFLVLVLSVAVVSREMGAVLDDEFEGGDPSLADSFPDEG